MKSIKLCPNCNSECGRDEVHNGVGFIYGPYGCSCVWSEWDEYNQLIGNGGKQEDGSTIDTLGIRHPV